MSKLQNNFTTTEQSKRLLELGVPADSADCYLTRFGIDEDWEVKVLNYDKYSDVVIGNQDYCIPCWSVGRLMEIYDTCVHSQFNSEITWCNVEYVKNKLGKTYIEYLVNIFAVHIKDLGDVDFSKLEE